MSRPVFLLPAAVAVIATLSFCLPAGAVHAQAAATPTVKVSKPAKFMRTQPLRDMRWSLPPVMQRILHYEKGPVTPAEIKALRKQLTESGQLPPPGKILNLPRTSEKSALPAGHVSSNPRVHDPVVQHSLPAAPASAGGFTQPFASFDGLGASTGLDIQYVPPNANSAVGQKYVIEAVNASFGIFDKASGKMIFGPVPNNSLWTGFGGACENQAGLNPAVVYDQLAHRWVLSHYAKLTTSSGAGTQVYQCLAVSQTDNPTGAWYLYAFQISDHPLKVVTPLGGVIPPSPPSLAVWPDAWYAGDAYAYQPGDVVIGVFTHGEIFAAFDRKAMLAGDPDAQMVEFDVANLSAYKALPAALAGYNPPPAGASGLFINATTGGFIRPIQVLALRQLQVDWSNPSQATLGRPAQVRVARHTRLCSHSIKGHIDRTLDCLTQPKTAQKLDAVADGLMYRATYRNLGDHQVLVLDQTVGVDTSGDPPAGIRWYELDAPEGATEPSAWTMAQQSTFAPSAASSGTSRWLGSISMDRKGNMALGYNLVGPDTDPSIVYTGRHVGDPAGQMTEPETILQAGGGDQTGTNLWGTVSSMAVAPDDCSFWYTGEYYAESRRAAWSTHIGAFKFSDCTPAPQGTLVGTVTDAASGQPIANAKVILNGDIVTKTNDHGHYSIKLHAGDYSITTKIFGYASANANVTVTAGETTTQDLQLSAAAKATVAGKVTDGSGHGWALYAEIKVFTPDFGQVADVWTDPKTGAYSVKLPEGSDYTLRVVAYVKSYQPGKATITDLSGDATKNFALKNDGSCTTPGYYSFKINQNFNDGFPPAGWKVANEVKGSPVVWVLNSQSNPALFKDGNFTGGSGTAADADYSNAVKNGTLYTGDFDTSLISPPFAVTSLPPSPVLSFKMNFQTTGSGSSALDVDIRADGGKWQNIARYTKNHGARYELPGTTQRLGFAKDIPQGAKNIQLRWHYYFIPGTGINGGVYAQVDDVRIGRCSLIAGGLVQGQVTDKNTGEGIADATVKGDAGDGTRSIENTADPSLPIGYYSLFVPTGKHTLSVSKRDYQSAEKTVSMANNSVEDENFSLGAGQFTASPKSLDVHVNVNGSTEKAVTLKNSGSAQAHYQVVEVNRPQPPATAVGPAATLFGRNGGSRRDGTLANGKPLPKAFKASLCPPGASASCATKPTWGAKKTAAPAAESGAGTVLSTFFTGQQGASFGGTYGLGFDRDTRKVWVGYFSLGSHTGDDKDHQFWPDGTPTGATIDVSDISSQGFEADMAYDDNTGMLWQLGVSLQHRICIYELSPYTMKATGRRICPEIDTGQQTALAYDPTTNSWYSTNFKSDTTIYHFDASGRLLDFAYQTGAPILGLTYNPATGHLFASLSGQAVDVAVFDTRHNYKLLKTFTVGDLGGTEGAGFGHDCQGHLWITSVFFNEVYEAESGEGGWCDFKHIPWLAEAPAGGTVASGDSATVTFDFNGADHKPFTTSHSQVMVRSNTPYSPITIPVTVHWDAQPVNLSLTGSASPSPVQKGGNLAYTLTVANAPATGDSAATETTLTYPLPAGVRYLNGGGDGVTCTGPAGSSAAAASPSPQPSPGGRGSSSVGTVSCDLGTLDQGASKTVTIAVKANTAGTLTSAFKVSARESSGDTGNNSLTLKTEVLGAADMSASGTGTDVKVGSSATLHFKVANGGPDTATGVKLALSAGSGVKLTSTSTDQGSCSASGNGFACDLGDVASGKTVAVDVGVTGVNAGTPTVTGEVTADSDDPDQGNNVATATVTVTKGSGGGGKKGGGGGGGFGGLGLAALLALVFLSLLAAQRRRGSGRGILDARGSEESPFCSPFPKTAKGKIGSGASSPLQAGGKIRRKSVMSKGWAMALVGAAVLALGVAMSTPAGAQSASWAAKASTQGLSATAAAHKINPPSRVEMAPQSSLSLLKRATKVGPHAEQAKISLIFGLKLRHVKELKHFLDEVQNPRSPLYHQFLTPVEFTAKYGPTHAQVAKLEKFLKRQGIEVTSVSPDRLLVHTRGSTQAFEHALEIRINNYQLNGRGFYSTGDSPRLPSKIAPLVVNILGLNHGLRMRPLSHVRPFEHGGQVAPRAAPPPATAYFNPLQIAKAYDWPDITDPKNAAGVSIAIATAVTQNVDTNPNYHYFWNAYGLPDHVINVIPVGGEAQSNDAAAETTLDVEYSGAMAPGATLNVYVAADAMVSTFAAEYDKIVSDNKSQVMTTSFGLSEPSQPNIYKSDEQIFMKGAAQGISMFAASGDNGASDCAPPPGYCPPGNNNADFPSSSKYITAANGTELSIADTSGTYGSEQASVHTGGAISELFERPDWQVGPGLPKDVDMRMNSDLAMNYGSVHPYLFIFTGGQGTGYYVIGGTSAVAPQLAGLYAIGISENDGESYGQSNKLLYYDVNANVKNYATDFHDVTTGCNGKLPDGSLSCAGVAWDHPTGWGSPKGKNLLSHLGVKPTLGTLKGTVTDADTGTPVADAKIKASPGFRHTQTNDKGQYSFKLPAGSYTVTAKSFGYQIGTVKVTITKGETTTQDIQLQPAPSATISGKVTDGSGHGWALYAEITATTPDFGQVGETWTNPKTGIYSLKLPKGFPYTLQVTPYFDYTPKNATLKKLTGDVTKNIVLLNPSCSAPGYQFTGITEGFNNLSSFPPDGWTRTYSTKRIQWFINKSYHGGPDFAWGDPNWTGGSGESADVNVNNAGYTGYYDASLVSPEIPVGDLPADPQLSFKFNYQHHDQDALNVDIRADGGKWKTVKHFTKSHGGFFALPGVGYKIGLGKFIPAGTTNIQLRWRYYRLTGPTSTSDWYVQVDDVRVGACQTLSGGLVEGQVTDKNTGGPLVGAKVSVDTGNSTKTIENKTDPNLPMGYYFLFAPAGQRTLTASAAGYADTQKTVSVTNNSIEVADIALGAGLLAHTPTALDIHVPAGGQKNAELALQNSGTASAHYRVVEANEPVPPASGAQPAAAFAHSPSPLRGEGRGEGSLPFEATLCGNGACTGRTGTPAAATGSGPGSIVSTLDPGLQGVYGLGVNHDAQNLWVGSISLNGAGGDDKDHQFLFDGTATGKTIDVSSFSPGGFEADMAYDDNSDTLWQIGSEDPSEFCIHEFDPVSAKLTGRKICPDITPYQMGLAYDPLTNTWYSADFQTQVIYHFDSSGRVLSFKNMGINVIGLTYNPATGHLFATISKPTAAAYDVYVIDPKSDYKVLSAFAVPGLDGFAGSGLGHDCAGHLWLADSNNNEVYEVRSGETGWCDFKAIPWLTESPVTGTVPTGASARVALSIDGSGRKPFTTSHTQLLVRNNTPYGVQFVPITVHWDPHPADLVLTGSAAPDSVKKGENIAYTLTVANAPATGNGAATHTTLTYQVPAGVTYVSGGGDGVTCTAPTGGTTSAPATASAPASGTVSCDLGTMAQGASKTVTIAVKANTAGTIASTFKVSAREPDGDTRNNTLTLKTEVIGTADVSASAADTTITEGQAGTLAVKVANNGPDTAAGVKLKLSAGSDAKLESATSDQGSCSASGSNGLGCDLGDLASGQTVTVMVKASGAAAGMATLTAHATTDATDPNPGNNVAQATVTIKAANNGGGKKGGGGGGGAFGWLALAALFGLVGLGYRRRHA
jgi:uncharacterized repeat protein (TIGR01451 family)